jgi:hypothetical protein
VNKLQRLICLMPLCAVACVQVNSQTQTRPQNDRRPLLFRGARVIVGDGRVIENAAFLVRDGLLMQVGTNADVTAPADAVVMDVRGKTVMPAIVNAHSHLGWEKYTSWGSRNFTRDNLIDHLYRHAYYLNYAQNSTVATSGAMGRSCPRVGIGEREFVMRS